MEKKKTAKKEIKKDIKETKQDNKRNQLKATIVGVALIVAALSLGIGTYAYYQTVITGTVSGTITAWSFLVNNEPQTFSANLVDLKPGVSGNITLNLSAEDSGLGVKADISFGNKTNWPSNLKLYSDSSKQSEIVVGSDTLSKTIDAGRTESVVIYYEWPYGEGPEENTYGGQTASVTITVVGTQVQ